MCLELTCFFFRIPVSGCMKYMAKPAAKSMAAIKSAIKLLVLDREFINTHCMGISGDSISALGRKFETLILRKRGDRISHWINDKKDDSNEQGFSYRR